MRTLFLVATLAVVGCNEKPQSPKTTEPPKQQTPPTNTPPEQPKVTPPTPREDVTVFPLHPKPILDAYRESPIKGDAWIGKRCRFSIYVYDIESVDGGYQVNGHASGVNAVIRPSENAKFADVKMGDTVTVEATFKRPLRIGDDGRVNGYLIEFVDAVFVELKKKGKN